MDNKPFRYARNVMTVGAVLGVAALVIAGHRLRASDLVVLSAATAAMWLGAVVIQFKLHDGRPLPIRDLRTIAAPCVGLALIIVGASSLLVKAGLSPEHLPWFITLVISWIVLSPWVVSGVRHWRSRNSDRT